MNKRWKGGNNNLKQDSPEIFEDEDATPEASSEDEVQKNGTPSRTNHSTPIQQKQQREAGESPDLRYLESPIEPLTQNPPNEVGWDYQRPGAKRELLSPAAAATCDPNKTPKRREFLSKKRNSNSPLLYKPLKKKLIQEEQKQHMQGFMNELMEIEKRAKMIGERRLEAAPPSNDDDDDDDKEQQPEADATLQVSSDSPQPQPQPQAKKTHYSALMDDSIEKCMALCSQEVEAKVFGVGMKPAAAVKATNQCSAATNSNSAKDSKEKKEPSSLEIPDDSFDDLFVGLDTEEMSNNSSESKLMNGASDESQPKRTTMMTQSSHYELCPSRESSSSAAAAAAQRTCAVQVQVSKPRVQQKLLNTKASFGYLSKNCVPSVGVSSSSSSNTSSSDVRLLKAKSFSDSHFLQQSGANGSRLLASKSGSMGWKQRTNESGYGGSTMRRMSSSASIGNLSGEASKGSSLASSSEGCLLQSTPAEIEKKRLEAIMRREEKLKRTQRWGVKR